MRRPFDVSKFRKEITKSIEGMSIGYNDPKDWISTGNYALNYRISSDFNKGVPLGKVTVFAGESGCLPASAKVKVRIKDNGVVDVESGMDVSVEFIREWFAETERYKNLGDDFVKLDRVLEIETPDGFQPVVQWFDKGKLSMVTVATETHVTTCAVNHLLQHENGEWIAAEHVTVGMSLQTITGNEKVVSVIAAAPEECFDFTVDHPNHRYWGDGFSSHNSGKSYICSGNLIRHAQEQGIYVILIDTENALDEEWLTALGVNTSEDHLLKLNMAMIDDVAKTISTFMKEYKQMSEDERPKVLFVIDSIGMLMTPTEVNQFEAGDMKGDMGRKAKALKHLVTNCVNMFGNMNVGMVATNHTYASQDMFDPDDKISGGCLTAGHRVRMADGSTKNIEDIIPGDVVITLDGDVEVTETYRFEDKEVYELVLSDNTTVRASAEHKFLVRNGLQSDDDDQVKAVWTPVQDLPLLSVIQFVGSTARLVSKKKIDTEPVYDICVPGAHHYILDNNLISHNSGFVYASSIVVAMKKLKLKEDENGVKTSKVHGIRAMCKVMKSRYAKPFETVEVQIPYSTGMAPESGLLSMFEEMGVVTKDGNKLSYTSKKTGEVIKEFRKNWTVDLLKIIMDEWEEDKYDSEVHTEGVTDEHADENEE